jgi:GTP-binding protein
VDNALAIEQELAEYSEALIERPIWLALSKVDQLDKMALQELRQEMAETFPDRPVYSVSALGDIGLDELKNDLMQFLNEQRLQAQEDPEAAEYLQQLERRISDDVFTHSERMRQRRRLGDEPGDDELDAGLMDDELDDWQEGDTEVIYVRE